MERMLLRSQPQSKGKTGTIQQLRAFETGERAVLFLHRHDEAVHDVILPLRRVLAHVEIEDRPDSARGAYSTLLVRISLPMNCANSFGLISPRLLNRVISGLPPSSFTKLSRLAWFASVLQE